MVKKKAKSRCSKCQGHGTYPFCDQCFRSSNILIQRQTDKRARESRAEDQATRTEREHWESIHRFKYLENCKVLKNMLKAAQRSRGLLATGDNDATNNMIDRITKQVHYEIEEGELDTYAKVINRFDQLLIENS